MNVQRFFLAVTFSACAMAHAHAAEPRDKIEVACSTNELHMGAIANALSNSRLWASQGARRNMLSLARQSCRHGAVSVTFVPKDEQRSCQTVPKWSTLCVEPAANQGEAP